MVHTVCTNLLSAVRDEVDIIDEMSKDGLLEAFHEETLGFESYYHHLNQLVSQIAHRHPNLEVLEIGMLPLGYFETQIY